MGEGERRQKKKQDKEKKRKRQAEDEERPSKRPATESIAETLKFSAVEITAESAPAILTAPGLSPPTNVALEAYYKPRPEVARQSRAGRSEIEASDLLLHTSAHPTVEYVAREEEANGENLMRHYLGIYDPKTGEVQMVEARKLVVRSILKSELEEAERDEDEEENLSRLAARNALGETFGTKKAKKAIRALTDNAIKTESSPHPNANEPLASAVLSSMPKSNAVVTAEDLQDLVDEGKPRPKPNFKTEILAEVYSIEDLIGVATLEVISVTPWIDKIEAGDDVRTSSRYVSRRLARIVKSKDVLKIKTLRYLLILLDWYGALKPGGKEGKKLPTKADDSRKAVSAAGPVSSAITDSIRRRFAKDFTLNKWSIDYLMTHICALALHIDEFSTDIHDLKEDLRLESKAMQAYFKELGCKISAPGDAEMKKHGWSKADAQVHKIAKLKLPLELPKTGARMTRRGR